jgi:hypothetical protein
VRAKFESDLRRNDRGAGSKLEQAQSTISILEDQLAERTEAYAKLSEQYESLKSMVETLQKGMDTLLRWLSFRAPSNDEGSRKRKKRHVETSPSVAALVVQNGGSGVEAMDVSPSSCATTNDSQMDTSDDSSAAPTVPRTDGLGVLMGKVKSKTTPRAIPFPEGDDQLRNTPVGTLLSRVSLENIKIVSAAPVALGVKKTVKERGKKAYLAAMECATLEDKAILNRRCPSMDDESYQAHVKTVSETAQAVSQRLFDNLAHAHKEKYGKPWHVQTLNKMSVTAVYNTLDKLRKKQTNATS